MLFVVFLYLHILIHFDIFQDDKPAMNFTVACPEYPFFHPYDTPDVADFIGPMNSRVYGVYDGVSWSLTKLAQKIKANDLLRLNPG